MRLSSSREISVYGRKELLEIGSGHIGLYFFESNLDELFIVDFQVQILREEQIVCTCVLLPSLQIALFQLTLTLKISRETAQETVAV